MFGDQGGGIKMEYLRKFNESTIFENKQDIPGDWILNSDNTYYVAGNVNLNNKGLSKIPYSFSEVYGFFDCDNNNLTSLVGCPKYVYGDYFSCSFNRRLTTLKGAPFYIDGEFSCMYNKGIDNFDGFPRHCKEINLNGTPIKPIFNLFADVYLKDGGDKFSTSGTLMDLFWDLDPIRENKVIITHRMNHFLYSLDRELTPKDIRALERVGWRIQ